MMQWITLLLFVLAIGGCALGEKGGGGGNPQAGVNLIGAKLGSSGGFVDVDGDGTLDQVVGAPSAVKSSKTGVGLVYKGSSTGFASTYAAALIGDDSFGSSFVNLGDVDGDSKEEFAVGAIYGDGEDVSFSGAVHIYKGGSNGQTIIKKLAGEGPMDRFGMSLASGDLNGDGTHDIIIGAPFNTNDPALYQSGAVYIHFGPDFTASVSLHASSTHKGLGWSVASGDINNDGIPDLLISGSGKVLGYYGGSPFAPNLDAPDLKITGSAAGLGKTLTVIGDLDGDGFREIAIGAPKAVIGANRDVGSVYIVKGGTGARTINLNASSAEQIVRIDGVNLFDRFGSSLAAVDSDGDNLIDLAVGAPTADVDAGLLMAGKVYLFKGKDIGSATTLSDATVFNGAAKYQGYGTFIAAGPNRTLLVGSPMSNQYDGDAAVVDLAAGEPATGGGGGGTPGGGTHEHDH